MNMKPTVYLDSTIVSLYYDDRASCSYRRERTREWWDTQRDGFDCYTSYFTEREVRRGSYPNQEHVVAMVQRIPYLEYIPSEMNEIIDVYIRNFVMPDDAQGDAAHLAMASYHGVDYLLTWNCNHLANAFKFKHIDRINLRLGLETPLIVTPDQLFPEESDA
jgi:hypothetical protein